MTKAQTMKYPDQSFTSTHLKQTDFNVIGINSKIEGDIEFGGPTIIWGTIRGNVSTHSYLVVEKTGKVEGNIKCSHIDIAGRVYGSIDASEITSLAAGAYVEGAIRSKILSLHAGSVAEVDIKTES